SLVVAYTCGGGVVDNCPNDPNKTEPGQCGCGVPEGTCGGDTVDATTLKGKVMAGYQGWFGTSCDGSGKGWRHWASSKPKASNITFDMWPDMREYSSSELCATDFTYSNGQNAGLFSAYNAATVDHHVKWMKDYGIDGVFVQRFVLEAVEMTAVRDKVLKNVQVASEKYGRVFVNMYDTSGANASNLVSDIKKDWMHLVDDQKITSSSRYLRHNGRPLLVIWGLGFDDRPGTASQATELINWLTKDAPSQYRVTLMGGIDSKWRSHSSSWLDVYRKFNVISPWAVGRYGDDGGADNYKTNYITPDLADCKSRGIDYMPVIFPGFSWHNLKSLKNEDSPLNKFPRRGGKFFWRQAYNAVSAGADMIYVAMYDEVDEGTAMFKIAENSAQVPTTGEFVKLNIDGTALPSDWYLKLMGQTTKMLRKQITLTSTIPITP
ncbi:MAG: glycoside hydrolase family 71/99-like protein, partial [Myxococcota bacterium]|nr:glycoside hydrolase family 71/99-like protein [Myxococcota bacterium]